MKASSLSFRSGVLFVLAGMVWGLQMGLSNDHSAFPAHAHLNLLGFVSLFLFGFYYRMHPSLDRSRIARAQVGVWISGTIVMAIGVALVHTGRAGGDPIAAIGSIITLAAMLTFAWLLLSVARFRASINPNFLVSNIERQSSSHWNWYVLSALFLTIAADPIIHPSEAPPIVDFSCAEFMSASVNT